MNASGTWVPVLGTSQGGAPATYLYQAGTWQRTGNIANVQGRVGINGKGSLVDAGIVIIGGVPLRSNSGVLQGGLTASYWQGMTGVPAARISLYVHQNDVNWYMTYGHGSGSTGVGYVTGANLTANFDVIFGGTFVM